MKTGRTFVEKIFNAGAGSIVCCEPDVVLSHDNSARVRKLFEKIRGEQVLSPEKLVVVLDRKMTGSTDELIHDYNSIHDFMDKQHVERFFDCDKGICHQVVAEYLKEGMLVVGSDSHTCTAGAFNCLAVGLNKTETAVLWKTGKMWFRVPHSIRITLKNTLSDGVYAKDLALWITGKLQSEDAAYQALEYHGEGVHSLSMADRMTLANVSAEIGVKNSVFPPDDCLADYFGNYAVQGVWADENARYTKEIEIDLQEIVPLVMLTHAGNEVKSVEECQHLRVQQGLIGACSNGRLEDLRVVAAILKDKKIAQGFQLSIVPASREIYLQAIEEGIIDTLFKAGASILGASCGPCLGSSHMILANTERFITTTNSNSMRRLSAVGVEKYVASPATVAMTALKGEVCAEIPYPDKGCPYVALPAAAGMIEEYDGRKMENVWNYADVDNILCDQLFAEQFTYHIPVGQPAAMVSHLLGGLDLAFAGQVRPGDVILAGENFGCGKLIKHAAVGMVEAGVQAILAKSVNRNFFRMASNHGLLVLVVPQVVESYRLGDRIEVDLENQRIYLNDQEFILPEFDPFYVEMVLNGGIVNLLRK